MGSVRDFRPVLFVVGILLITLSLAMMLPAIADAVTGDPHWRVFLAAGAFTLFIGTCLVLSNRMREPRLTVRQAFVLTTLSWVVVAAFAALPFAFSDLNLSYTDGYFEAMSGLTTTGSTVIVGLDQAPTGILLWRALLQWLGGIGIIVTAIAILPMLQIGGMQLFHTESSDSSEKVLPRAAQLAGAIGMVYLGLTVSNGIAYWAAGMTPFEGGVPRDDDHRHRGFFDLGFLARLLQQRGHRGHRHYLHGVGLASFRALLAGRARRLGSARARHAGALVLRLGFVRAAFACGLADGGQRRRADRCVSRGGLQRHLDTDRHRLLHRRLLRLGHLRASRLHAPHVHRRLYRLDHGRCKGLPNSGSGVHVSLADSPAHPAPRRLHQQVQQAADSGRRIASGDGVLLPVRGELRADRDGTGAHGTRLCDQRQRRGHGDRQRRPRPRRDHRPSGTFQPLPEPAKWLLSAAMLLGRLELFTVLVLFVPRFWRD